MTIESATKALEADGYTVSRYSGGGTYIANLAPSSDDFGGDTQPGSEWDEECDALLAAVAEIVKPHGCVATWVNDDCCIELS